MTEQELINYTLSLIPKEEKDRVFRQEYCGIDNRIQKLLHILRWIMTIGNFLAFIIGLFIGRVLTYLGDKTYKFLNRPKKKLENKEPLIFDGVDDFVKCAENSLKDYTVIKGDSWSAGKGHSHIIILENKENEKRDE